MPYDFNFENENESMPKSRTSEILSSLGQFIDKAAGNKENYLETFSMKNAWIWFIEISQKCPEIEQCLLQVTGEVGKYTVLLLCCDENGDPVFASEKKYYGRKIYTVRINRDIKDFLGNKKFRAMELSALR